jgi:hypothetical protein
MKLGLRHMTTLRKAVRETVSSAHAGGMKTVAYAGGSFLTSDVIAKAMLEYAAALSNANRAATLTVPSMSDGEQHDVQVLVGPASQLMAEDIEYAGPEPDGAGFLSAVAGRITALGRTYIPKDEAETTDWDI